MNHLAQDAVSIAAQTGRLDLVSVLLAIVAIFLAIGVFPIFFYLNAKATKVAKEAAKKELASAEAKVEAAAIEKLESMLPALFKDYMELIENSVTDEDANDIAAEMSREDEK